MQRAGAGAHPTATRNAATGDAETEAEALSVTHWFASEQNGDPYTATVRFTGRRIGVSGKPGPRDTFEQDESVDRVLPGSGPVSVTTWAYGIEPGEWTVTADFLPAGPGARTRQFAQGRRPLGGHTLPTAAWSWTRWALSVGQFAPVQTLWAPLVRMTRMPAVIPGSWSGLIGVGIVVGAVVQSALLARANVAVGLALLVDLVALVSGIVLAKLWYLALQPRTSWRQSIGEGWTMDGILFAAPVVGVAALTAFTATEFAFEPGELWVRVGTTVNLTMVNRG